jgi:hypothetical protein
MKVQLYFHSQTRKPIVEVDRDEMTEEEIIEAIRLLRTALAWCRREKALAARKQAKVAKQQADAQIAKQRAALTDEPQRSIP